MNAPTGTSWFYSDRQQTFGPVSADELSALIQQGQVSRKYLVMPEGGAEWQPVAASAFAEHLPQAAIIVQAPQKEPSAASKTSAAIASVQRGQNRNLLVLGIVALVALGGLAAFFASRSGGSITNLFQNTTNNITNNSYFTQLIALGMTTEADLKQVDQFQSVEGGFIGISKQALHWKDAQALAKRTAADILPADPRSQTLSPEALAAIRDSMSLPESASPWVMKDRQAAIFEKGIVNPSTDLEAPRKVLLYWFNPGPLVFEDALSHPESMDKFFSFHGGYRGRQTLVPGVGMQSSIGHDWGASWAKAVLGERSRIRFQISLKQTSGVVAWVVNGSGLGSSLDSGYSLILGGGQLKILRLGEVFVSTKLSEPLAEGTWTEVETSLNGGRITVKLNGQPVVDTADREPLTGPLHQWFAFAGHGVTYRDVRIWSSETQQDLERQHLPAPTIKPRPDGEVIYELKAAGGSLPAPWIATYPAEAVSVSDGRLVFTATRTNHRPLILLDMPLPTSVAVEFDHEYSTESAHGLELDFISAAVLPKKATESEALWKLYLPSGNGKHLIQRSEKSSMGTPSVAADSRFDALRTLLASTPFFAPVQDRKYRIRAELSGAEVKVFVDGRFLLEAKRPSAAPTENLPVFFGLGQSFASSTIHSLKITKLNAAQ